MNKIASFCVNHDILKEGMYTSRVDGDITTYDIRMVVPNVGPYLENAAMHTYEHLFATFARNNELGENVIYVGPMGCRTGFYLLVRNLTQQQSIDLVKQSIDFISDFNDEIPGASTSAECGNYKEQDLNGAKNIAIKMKPIIEKWTVEKLEYLK